MKRNQWQSRRVFNFLSIGSRFVLHSHDSFICREEESMPIQPFPNIPMLLLCGPRKTLAPVNRRGKRKMSMFHSL